MNRTEEVKRNALRDCMALGRPGFDHRNLVRSRTFAVGIEHQRAVRQTRAAIEGRYSYEPHTLDCTSRPASRCIACVALQCGLGLLSERCAGHSSDYSVGPGITRKSLVPATRILEGSNARSGFRNGLASRAFDPLSLFAIHYHPRADE